MLMETAAGRDGREGQTMAKASGCTHFEGVTVHNELSGGLKSRS